MAKMNKVMDPNQMSKVTQQFTQEHTKLGIKEEMSMSNTLPNSSLSSKRSFFLFSGRDIRCSIWTRR